MSMHVLTNSFPSRKLISQVTTNHYCYLITLQIWSGFSSSVVTQVKSTHPCLSCSRSPEHLSIQTVLQLWCCLLQYFCIFRSPSFSLSVNCVIWMYVEKTHSPHCDILICISRVLNKVFLVMMYWVSQNNFFCVSTLLGFLLSNMASEEWAPFSNHDHILMET